MTDKFKMEAMSADLRRVSYWIYDGRKELANRFLRRCKQMGTELTIKIQNKNLTDQLAMIENDDRMHGAERALTISRIVWWKAQEKMA